MLVEERQIINQLREGQTDTYQSVIREYNGLLYSIRQAFHLTNEKTRSEMQKTYVDVFHLILKEKTEQIKKTLTITMLEKCKKLFEDDLLIENHKAMKSQTQPFSKSDLKNKTFNEVIEIALEHLPVDNRVLYTLVEINQFSIEEAAEILNRTKETVEAELEMTQELLHTKIAALICPNELYEFNLIYCDDMVNRVMKEIK